MKKVMVAMSGGVDSSVALALLVAQGYDCVGVTLKLYNNDDIGAAAPGKTCCTQNDAEDAALVAAKLNVRHYVYNYAERFRKDVVDRFVSSYLAGETPNPCIDCNRYIKFSALAAFSEQLGCDFFATGHYARTAFNPQTSRYELFRNPTGKDQSYVLYALTQRQLSRVLFPLGDLDKTAVRGIAREYGFINGDKPDSQDICFIPDGDHAGFIRRYMADSGDSLPTAGVFLDINGNILGGHDGQYRFTVGQRKGTGVSFGTPLYVAGKDARSNTVTLAPAEHLLHSSLTVRDVNWIAFEHPAASLSCTAKIRYHGKDFPCTVHPQTDETLSVIFDQPVRAPAPGQAVAFCDGDRILGGGTINNIQS
jgi:tRNA-specific 2-thiouridylase